MKILVADKFEKSGLEALNAAGFEVISDPRLKEEALVAAIKEKRPDVIIVRSTVVSKEMLTDSPLKLVVRAGSGYNTIDVETAAKNGIFVSNCPGMNSIAVAELALGLILALDRRIPDNVEQFRHGKWNKKEFSKAPGLYGKTLGIIGLGHIGQEVAKRGRAFGMKIAGWTRWLTPDVAAEMDVELYDSVEELAANCDILTIHVAQNKATTGLVSEAVLANMKPGSMFINTSRAKIVDQKALLKYAEEKAMRVGLDVFDEEPATGDGEVSTELAKLPNVYVTHHIGASTDQAQEAVSAETVRIITEFSMTGTPPNTVTIPSGEVATHLVCVRHADRERIMLFLAGLGALDVEHFELVNAEGFATYATLSGEPAASGLDALRPHVRAVSVRPL